MHLKDENHWFRIWTIFGAEIMLSYTFFVESISDTYTHTKFRDLANSFVFWEFFIQKTLNLKNP